MDWVLAEPAEMWQKDLRKNRKANIETKCVWTSSGENIVFNETEVGELSTVDSFSDTDKHKKSRKSGKRYTVETIALLDLLDKFEAPKLIDYLSIDTEGSEYEILKNFDFDKYKFRVITCEHNHTSMRQKIFDLLTNNGYVRKFEEISKFDDWYVLA